MGNINTAIIYYCYNRIDHTKKSLRKVFEYKKELPLYIFCDGQKEEDDIEVFKVKTYIEETFSNLKNTKIVFRNRNYGLASNVINGVNQVFEEGFDSVIVLEDDCVPKKEFFDFMGTALNFYKTHKEVMHISGFGLPIKQKTTLDAYFTPYPCSWGWGTWKENWEKCNFEDQTFYNEVLKNPILKTQFDWAGKSFSNFLELQLNGDVNSWLIRWYAHIFKTKGVCLWATKSKLVNIGFDGTGEHKVRFDRFNQNQNQNQNSFNFKKDVAFDLKMIREFRQFFMGPKISDKIKTIIYMFTGVILDKFIDRSKYYYKE